jgi:hypothetical protein
MDRLTAINDLGAIGVLDKTKLAEMQQQLRELLNVLRQQREAKKAEDWVEAHKIRTISSFL